jgi:hypothetical protein
VATNYLCMFTNLTSSEWAAWVQAIGSILAIVGSVGVAIWQLKRQQEAAAKLERDRRDNGEIEAARSIRELCARSVNVANAVREQLGDKAKIAAICTGREYYYRGALEYLEKAIASIPLHTLPSRFVVFPMLINGCVEQLRRNVDVALEHYSTLNDDQLHTFLHALSEAHAQLQRELTAIDAAIQASVGSSSTTISKSHGEALAAKQAPAAPDALPKGVAWRGWLWILLFVAIVALLAQVVVRAADSPAIPPAEPDRRGTEQQPIVISKPLKERRLEQVDKVAHANNERAMTIATVVLALFTAALWLANIHLIRETKRVSARQAADTQQAIGEAKRSADAMQRVAQATESNAVLLGGMLAKQMRAYVAVNIGRGTAQRGDLYFGSQPEITNVGLTPAKKVSYRVQAAILATGLPKDYVFPEPQQTFTNDATLNPRQAFTIGAAIMDRFDPAEVVEISKGEHKRLYVWGTITYDDVFEGHWETKFCHNFVFFDTPDPETGKTLHQFNGFYFAGHNDTT